MYPKRETIGKKETKLLDDVGTNELLFFGTICEVETTLYKEVSLCIFYTFLISFQYFMRQECILILSPNITPTSSKRRAFHTQFKKSKTTMKIKS